MKDVYTIDDLRHPDSSLAQLAKPARLAVIGDPISHSKSPQLHQPALDALYKETGKEEFNCSYIRLHLSAEDFNEGVSLLKALNFIGCNVTVPHKERALEWATQKDSFAEQVGVANTIVFKDNSCYTTDPMGLESALKEEFNYSLKNSRIFITGAGGGAGSAVSQYIVGKGISHTFMYNRTPEKLDDVYDKIIAACSVDLTKVSCHGGGQYPANEEVELLINATSLGLKEADPCPIPTDYILPDHLVYDMTYGCENALSKACSAAGAKYVNGLSMLRHQGAEAFKLWFPEVSDPITRMGLA